MTDGHKTWMDLAAKAASVSPEERKVGAVFVPLHANAFTTGWNAIGTMHGVVDWPDRRERPEKYLWIEHAERRAIYEAARRGVPTEGGTMYVTWFPCMDCARAVVECRISTLVYGKEPDLDDPMWGRDFRRVRALLGEAGVTLRCEPCP